MGSECSDGLLIAADVNLDGTMVGGTDQLVEMISQELQVSHHYRYQYYFSSPTKLPRNRIQRQRMEWFRSWYVESVANDNCLGVDDGDWIDAGRGGNSGEWGVIGTAGEGERPRSDRGKGGNGGDDTEAEGLDNGLDTRFEGVWGKGVKRGVPLPDSEGGRGVKRGVTLPDDSEGGNGVKRSVPLIDDSEDSRGVERGVPLIDGSEDVKGGKLGDVINDDSEGGKGGSGGVPSSKIDEDLDLIDGITDGGKDGSPITLSAPSSELNFTEDKGGVLGSEGMVGHGSSAVI
ncbi:hypothetical protein H0H93_013663 [Arthromyces matolae]|nr:hypothetical protein H0H93_013663 [Arthromyces matolae]